jgi:hypothetical protein
MTSFVNLVDTLSSIKTSSSVAKKISMIKKRKMLNKLKFQTYPTLAPFRAWMNPLA